MSLTKDEILKVANLSRIELAEGELDQVSTKLNSIMGWVEQLQEVDVEGVVPMAGVGDNTLRLRRDEVMDGNCKDKVLSNAPKQAFDCYVVPKVVDQG